MKIVVNFAVGIALSLIAVTAAEARGPSARPWIIYPAKAIDSCQAGTAPDHFAGRCSELLSAYSRALQTCEPAPGSQPLSPESAQIAFDACASSAARTAAGQVK